MTGRKHERDEGKSDDFAVYVDSMGDLEDYRRNPGSHALVDLVSVFKVFTARARGSQNMDDEASSGQLASEFGTANQDEVIARILKDGECQGAHYEVAPGDRFTSTNDTKGARGVSTGSGHHYR